MKLEHRGNCIIIKFIPDRDEADGMFDEDNGKIYIRSRLGLLERECIYYHELSHKECCLKKCPCWETDYLCEYHAMRGELNKIIARDSIILCKAYLKSIDHSLTKYRRNMKVWRKHLAAMQRIMRTKAFKQLKRGCK